MTMTEHAAVLRMHKPLVVELREMARDGCQPDCDLDTLRRAADHLEGAELAFRSLIAAIEREGYEVLVEVSGREYSVRPGPNKERSNA